MTDALTIRGLIEELKKYSMDAIICKQGADGRLRTVNELEGIPIAIDGCNIIETLDKSEKIEELAQKSDEKLKQCILDTIEDLVSDFLCYDRKEDDGLGIGGIEKAVEDGVISVMEMVEVFEKHLFRCIRYPPWKNKN